MASFRERLRAVQRHSDLCLDLIRIYLGVGLVFKGLQFTTDKTFLTEALQAASQMQFLQTFLLHYIPIAHLGGGLLLAAGLLTRTSALFQLPILFGAVFLIYLPEGIFTHGQDFQFTALVLFLLLLFAVHGGGPWSLDRYMRRRDAGA